MYEAGLATHFIPHTLAESVEGALQVRACTRPPCHEQGAVRRPAAAHAVEGVWFGIHQCMACACAGVCLVAPALLCVSCAWHWSECALVQKESRWVEWNGGRAARMGVGAGHTQTHTHTHAPTHKHTHTRTHTRAHMRTGAGPCTWRRLHGSGGRVGWGASRRGRAPIR